MNSHSNKVTDIAFIKGGRIIPVTDEESDSSSSDSEDEWGDTDYLIASVSVDRRVVIMSLRQRIPVFTVDLQNFLS